MVSLEEFGEFIYPYAGKNLYEYFLCIWSEIYSPNTPYSPISEAGNK